MAGFTPGPWIVRLLPHAQGFARVVQGGKGNKTIARVHSDPSPAYVSKANAQLIAAAPELLEALVHLEGFLANKGFSAKDPLVRGMARAAIAKATQPESDQ